MSLVIYNQARILQLPLQGNVIQAEGMVSTFSHNVKATVGGVNAPPTITKEEED